MSDFFNIGSAIKGAIHILYQSMRCSGRTTNLVKSLKCGDRVVCLNNKDANLLKGKLKDFGVDGVEILVRNPRDLNLNGVGTAQGRTVFDHRFVEEWYLDAIEDAGSVLHRFEQDLSGFDERHIETRKKAQEIFKWRI